MIISSARYKRVAGYTDGDVISTSFLVYGVASVYNNTRSILTLRSSAVQPRNKYNDYGTPR